MTSSWPRVGLAAIAAGLIAATVVSASPAEASNGVAAVSAAAGHACALTTTGGVQCWGGNHNGELGDGTRLPRNAPVVIPSLTSGVAQISAGEGYTCALTTSGGVKCWGSNLKGQLGDGTRADSDTPVDVFGLTSGVAQISAGPDHACAVTTAGGVKCWGYNKNGQLGDGTTKLRDTPTDVSGLSSGIAHVSAGIAFTCALTTSGGVKCWGNNLYGELGDGSKSPVTNPTPLDVSGLSSGVAQLASAGGYDACVLTTAGGVKCWGYNGTGQLGDGTHTDRDVPVVVPGLSSGVAQISAGYFDTCALTAAGAVKCWGADRDGELGRGTNGPDSTTPVNVPSLSIGVAQVSVGGAYACALTAAARVRCWGNDGGGELGDGSNTNSNVPTHTLGFTVTTTSLTLGHAEVQQGAMETFSITVDAGGPTPTGTVQIYINNIYLGSGALKHGKLTKTLLVNLPGDLGPYPAQAVYEGHGAFSSSVGIQNVVISSSG